MLVFFVINKTGANNLKRSNYGTYIIYTFKYKFYCCNIDGDSVMNVNRDLRLFCCEHCLVLPTDRSSVRYKIFRKYFPDVRSS